MRRDIGELKRAVEGTNAAVAKTNEALVKTNAVVANTSAALAKTNAVVEKTSAALEKTNAALEKTNEAVAKTNAELGNTNAMLKRTMITVARLAGSMTDMRQYMAENLATKQDISGLNSRMDGFSGLLLDSRHRWAVHAETLAAHDERIKKLESPSA